MQEVQWQGGVRNLSRPVSPSARSRPRISRHDGEVVDLFSLPEERHTLALVERYFSNTGLLYPYLDREAFLQKYAEMKQKNFRKIRRTWLGLLNMVLALAISTTVLDDDDAIRRMEKSEIHYRKAIGLCQKQIMRSTSLEFG